MAETGKRPGRWMRVGLVVSLALNLAVAGMVLGAVLQDDGPWKGRQHDRDPDRMRSERTPQELRELGPVPFIAALSAEDRAALLDAARAHANDLQGSREALRARFEDMLRLLRTEPFDAEGMVTLLADQRAAGSVRQDVGEALLVQRFDAMGPAARVAYADRLDRSMKRGPEKR